MIFHGCSPCASNQAVRDVNVCVLPLPGPARIANVSAKEDTAACCDWLRLVSRPSGFIVGGVVKINRELVLRAGQFLGRRRQTSRSAKG